MNKKKKLDAITIFMYAIFILIGLLMVLHIIQAHDIFKAENISVEVGMNHYMKILEDGLNNFTKNPIGLTFTMKTVKASLIYFSIVAFAFYYVNSTKRKTLWKKEQGSAEWSKDKDDKKFAEKEFSKNMILTKSILMSMNTRKHRKNNNLLVIGGSGSGKTRFLVKPNIMQANCSMVITDPKGELLLSTATLLEKKGYDVKVFNLVDMEHSCGYNPFKYIRNENDVFKLITTLIKNTTPKGASSGDPFWEKSETAFLQAVFFYIWLECPINEQNFKKVMDLLREARASEEDESFESELDIRMNKLRLAIPNHIALKQYDIYKMASGKTAKSILISCGVRLSVFNLEKVSNLTEYDTVDLQSIGDKKTVLYIVIPDSDVSFNFLVCMLYSQLFNVLYYQADFGGTIIEKNNTYKSCESLDVKAIKYKKLWEEKENTKGAKKLKEIDKKINDVQKELKDEFGLKCSEKNILNIEKTRDIISDRYNKLCELHNILSTECSDDKKKEIIYTIENLFGLKKSKNPSFYLQEISNIISFLKEHLDNNGICHYCDYDSLSVLNDKLKINNELLKTEIEELNSLSFIQKIKDKPLYNEILENISTYKKEISKIERLISYEFGIEKKVNKKNSHQSNENYRNAITEKLNQLKGIENNSGRLKVPVRCLLDEFANIGEIPDFQSLISTMRSREIFVTIVIQNMAQLKEKYKDSWENITGNCSSLLFLGGQEQSTLEYISKKLGKATIEKRSTSRSKGKSGSYSQSWDTIGRELLTPDEVGLLKDNECILFIQGCKPFLSKKYDITLHPNYKLLSDYNKSNTYPFRERFSTKAIISDFENSQSNSDNTDLIKISENTDEENKYEKTPQLSHEKTITLSAEINKTAFVGSSDVDDDELKEYEESLNHAILISDCKNLSKENIIIDGTEDMSNNEIKDEDVKEIIINNCENISPTNNIIDGTMDNIDELFETFNDFT